MPNFFFEQVYALSWWVIGAVMIMLKVSSFLYWVFIHKFDIAFTLSESLSAGGFRGPEEV